MKIPFITDCHYGQDSNFSQHAGADYINVYGSQFEKLFNPLKARINNSDIDLVVNVGDCIADDSYLHGKTEESYLRDKNNFIQFVSRWQDVRPPVIHVLGNHDGAMIPRSDFEEILGRKTYFSQDICGVHHIVLDPLWDKIPFRIDEVQLQWLQDDLTATTLPTIVYLHTPCDETDLSDNYYHADYPERYFVADRERLRSIFEQSGKVEMVVHGHDHFYRNNDINGIKYLTIPSFLENDTTGQPGGEYVELDVNDANTFTPVIRRKKIRPLNSAWLRPVAKRIAPAPSAPF